MIQPKHLLVLLSTILFLSACGTKNDPISSTTTDCSNTGDVTYTAQMKTFFDTNCVSCHKVGGSQPNPLYDTYAGASADASNGLQQVQDGNMPPGGGDSITAQDLCNYQAWLNSGKIE